MPHIISVSDVYKSLDGTLNTISCTCDYIVPKHYIKLFFSRYLPIDEQRLRTVINMAANKASMSVTTAGHMFAIRSAASGLTPAASLSEMYSGLTQVGQLNTNVA